MDLYKNIKTLTNKNNIQYKKNILYPYIEPSSSDIYVITVVGDRLDLLAYDYYSDTSLWKLISVNNFMDKDSIFIEPGTQLRIPMDISKFLKQFNDLNK